MLDAGAVKALYSTRSTKYEGEQERQGLLGQQMRWGYAKRPRAVFSSAQRHDGVDEVSHSALHLLKSHTYVQCQVMLRGCIDYRRLQGTVLVLSICSVNCWA